jgi:serine protease AprX
MLRNASVPFGSTAYTSWLGTSGGFLDAGAIGRVNDPDDNSNQAVSQSLNPNSGAILAGNAVWGDASWANASWTNASWTNASWTGINWSMVSFDNGSWTNGSWTNASWTSATFQ